MVPPPLSVYGKLGDDRLFRIDGGQMGTKRYNLVLEVTDFKGSAWSSDFTLDAVKDSFEEMVPGIEDLLSWLSALASNPSVTWKQEGDDAWIEAAMEDVETIRLPPSGYLRTASAEDAGTIAAGIAFALYEDWQNTRGEGKGASRSAPRSGTGQGRAAPSQAAGSPEQSPHKVSRPPSAAQSQRADEAIGSSPGGSADQQQDGKQKRPQSFVDDDVPPEQRHRVVHGRGRGRMPFGTLGACGRRRAT